MIPSVTQQEAQIRAYAASIGIDPDIAVAVARSEGLAPGVWQSNVQQPYGRERSYGAFQLHVAPEGRNPGLGNEFVAKTGLDPADPANWEAVNKFALDAARRGGWSPWMGAKKIGVTGMAGIGGETVSPAPVPEREDRGGAYNSGYGTAAPAGLLDAAPTKMTDTEKEGWEALGQMGLKMAQKAQPTEYDEEEEMPQPQVLQPLRRIKLGKGLLG